METFFASFTLLPPLNFILFFSFPSSISFSLSGGIRKIYIEKQSFSMNSNIKEAEKEKWHEIALARDFQCSRCDNNSQ
jgi:hypothetical protein